MRGLEIETRNGARSRRAGSVRFKTVPRLPSLTRRPQPHARSKPKSKQHPQRSFPLEEPLAAAAPLRAATAPATASTSTERKRQALDDVATYRVVSVRDLVEQRFGGNAFAARQGHRRPQERRLAPRTHRSESRAASPSGCFTATQIRDGARHGAAASTTSSAIGTDLPSLRKIRHDATVYRAARSEISKLEKSGASIKRVQLDYEMKSQRIEGCRAGASEGRQ